MTEMTFLSTINNPIDSRSLDAHVSSAFTQRGIYHSSIVTDYWHLSVINPEKDRMVEVGQRVAFLKASIIELHLRPTFLVVSIDNCPGTQYILAYGDHCKRSKYLSDSVADFRQLHG